MIHFCTINFMTDISEILTFYYDMVGRCSLQSPQNKSPVTSRPGLALPHYRGGKMHQRPALLALCALVAINCASGLVSSVPGSSVSRQKLSLGKSQNTQFRRVGRLRYELFVPCYVVPHFTAILRVCVFLPACLVPVLTVFEPLYFDKERI